METRRETFTYEGLGFPIELINTPMKKVFGEWIIDIDMNKLQLVALEGLIHKPYPLTGKEMKFMRKFLKLTTTQFGENLGVSHATIVKWEKKQATVAPAQELYIRMYLFKHVKDKELSAFFEEITPKTLAKAKKEKQVPFAIDLKQIQLAS